MAFYQKQISDLTKKLDSIEQKLLKLSIEISQSTETSNLYWSTLKKQASQYYEEARVIYADWMNKEIPKAYNDDLASQIRRIKQLSFVPTISVHYNKVSKKDLNKQTISTILNDSLSSFYSATETGNNQLNRLLSATQQLNLKEKTINKAINEGFVKGAKTGGIFSKRVGKGSLYGAQRQLQNELLKKSLDGQYITIIDKNGKPRNYNIKSYAEMVARTKLIETQTAATVNISMAYGSGLVQVSSHNTLTAYDAQFEGKVFDLTGKNPNFPNADDLPPFHPNCLHTITVFFEEALNDSQLQKISDFSKGITDIHPTRPGHIPLSERENLK